MLKNCVMCHRKDTVRPWSGRFRDRFFDVEVETTAARCSACKELYFSGEELDEIDRQLAAVFVARGIRRGKEFWVVREVLEVTAVDVAKLLDVRPETISRWEKEHAELPRSAAFIMGELYARPVVTRDKLVKLATPIDTPAN